MLVLLLLLLLLLLVRKIDYVHNLYICYVHLPYGRTICSLRALRLWLVAEHMSLDGSPADRGAPGGERVRNG